MRTTTSIRWYASVAGLLLVTSCSKAPVTIQHVATAAPSPTKSAPPLIGLTVSPTPLAPRATITLLATETPSPPAPTATLTSSPTATSTTAPFQGRFDIKIALSSLYQPEGITFTGNGAIKLSPRINGNVYTSLLNVILAAPFTEQGKEKYAVLVGETFLGNVCHACGAFVEGSIFVRDADGWHVEMRNDELGAIGSFGEAPRGRLVRIGKDKYGFLFIDIFCGQGYCDTRLIIYANMAGQLKEILHTAVGGEATESVAEHYPPQVQFVSGSNTDFYDLVLRTIGSGPMTTASGTTKSTFTLEGSEYLLRTTTDPWMYLVVARQHVDAGNLEQAVVEYTDYLALDPEDGGVYQARGDIYLKMGQYDLALSDYDQAILWWPATQTVDVYTEQGLAFMGKGDYAQAVDAFTKETLLEYDEERHAEAFCYRGLAYAKLEESKKAITDLKECLLISSPDASADLRAQAEQTLAILQGK